jgi:thiol-disulfide isomerase/thioredoxin
MCPQFARDPALTSRLRREKEVMCMPQAYTDRAMFLEGKRYIDGMQTSLLRFGLPLAIILACSIARADTHVPTLAPGSSMPPFELIGVDGRIHHSSDWATSKVLVIVFTCDHCPTAQLYENRIKAIAADYAPKGVTLVAIQPNNPKAIRLDELGYTDVSDTFRDMKVRAEYRHFNFPYLYDGDTQTVSHAFGPAATPHVFVFDSSRHLRYDGRVDDSARENLVKRRDLREAIDSVLAGRPVAVPHTPSIGCSTKWAYKEETRNSEEEKFEQEPVKVTEVNAAGLKTLAQNSGGKVTLVNFWATWCGPCIDEMPDLITMWHMYRHRPFDLVMVSVNYPDERKGVLAALTRNHAANTNLLFGSTDSYALMHSFDADWNSAVPFTALIGPDGKVIWKFQGELDMLALKRRILASLPDDDYVGQQAYWSNH